MGSVSKGSCAASNGFLVISRALIWAGFYDLYGRHRFILIYIMLASCFVAVLDDFWLYVNP